MAPIQVTAAATPGPCPPARVAAPDADMEIVLGSDRFVPVRGHVDPTWLVQVLRGLEGPTC